MSNERDDELAASENTPLLANNSANGHGDPTTPAQPEGRLKRRYPRWPSLIALLLLCTLAVFIMLLAFFVPDAMEKYALQATTLDIKSVVPEFTDKGAKARIRCAFSMQGGKVENKNIRNLGVLGTWIAREVESKESTVEVTLPDYGNAVLGTAVVPPLKVSIVNGKTTDLDFNTDLIPPTDVSPLRELFDDWVRGGLDSVNVAGKVRIALKSGILSLPTSSIYHIISISGDQLPSIPQFNITKLNFHDPDMPKLNKGMVADATIEIENQFPLNLVLPALDFAIRVDDCQPDQPKIVLANATVRSTHIYPKQAITVNATGYVFQPSDSLTEKCPGSGKSPLDTLLGGYIRGHQVTLYISGAKEQSHDAPKWMAELLSGFTLPVPFTGHAFGNVIKNFTLAETKFDLPDPWAEPDTPESKPQISATIQAVIILPEEMNFKLDVDQVRAIADVFYKKKKMGELNLRKWQPATSTRLNSTEDVRPLLLIESAIDKAPLDITDQDVFTDVVQQILFGSKPVLLKVQANVDVQMETALGILTVQDIPAEGEVPVDTFANNNLDGLNPKVKSLSIFNGTTDGMFVEAVVDIDNPTNYSAVIPYADVNILSNGSYVGHTTVRNLQINQGTNINVTATAEWAPKGAAAKAIGIELLSQWISGYNTSVTIQTHEGTIPLHPELGIALSKLNITLPIPHLSFPTDPDAPDDDDSPKGGPRFIKSATMHLFSSTAQFTLLSPLSSPIIYITTINATAYYKEDAVGSIFYELPFAVPPGESESPRLPVDWSLGSVGYEAVRKAIGGELKLEAVADVGIKIGDWADTIWYHGHGIGAKIRI